MSINETVVKTLKGARTQRDHDILGSLYTIKAGLNDLLQTVEEGIRSESQRKELTKSIDKEYENS